jgi:hypothetical protein
MSMPTYVLYRSWDLKHGAVMSRESNAMFTIEHQILAPSHHGAGDLVHCFIMEQEIFNIVLLWTMGSEAILDHGAGDLQQSSIMQPGI